MIDENDGRLGHLAHATQIHRAILEGGALLVLDDTGGLLEIQVREAAAVAGRTRDLRVVQLHRAGSGALEDAARRRLAPASVPGHITRAEIAAAWHDGPGRPPVRELADLDHIAVGPASSAVGEPPPWPDAYHPALCHLDAFDPEDACGARSIVVFASGSRTRSERCVFDWFALAAIRRAWAEGRAWPFLVSTLRRKTLVSDLSGLAFEPIQPYKAELAFRGPPSDVARLSAPCVSWLARWQGAARAYVSSMPVADEAGVRSVCDMNSFVAFPSRQPHHMMTLLYVDAMGWGTALLMTWSEDRTYDEQVLELLRLVLTCSVDAVRLGSPDGGFVQKVVHHSELAVLAADPKAEGDLADLVRFAGPRLHFSVVPGSTNARSVHRQCVIEPDRRGRRADFVETWGIFADLILLPEVCAAVDAGIPTVHVVAQALGVTPAIARRLVGRRTTLHDITHDIGLAPGQRSDLALFAAALGHDLMPEAGNVAEWEAFRRCQSLSACTQAGLRLDPKPHGLTRDLMTRLPGRNWQERLAALDEFLTDALGYGREYEGIDGTPDFACTDVANFIVAFLGWIQRMGGVAATTFHAYAAMTGHGSTARLVDASIRWHRNPHLIQSTGLPPGTCWPVPFGTAHLGDGWIAICISTAEDFVAEGLTGPDASGMAGLSHCVATYGPACFEGRSLVVSLRGPVECGTARVSTAELVPNTKGDWTITGRPYRLAQHRGAKNGAPPDEAVRRLALLRDRLAGDGIPVDAAALEPRPQLACYVELRAETQHAEWDRYLPPALAGLDRASLLERFAAIQAATDATRASGAWGGPNTREGEL